MRIDLMSGGRRPWPLLIALRLLTRYIGIAPGPMVTISYRPDLVDTSLASYLLRGVSDAGPWTKGETELFAAFVSDLNQCHF
ncbi:MAG TPA: hypothetical protein VLS89_19070 [Candidatus Nanopelagicales bacterium]|nr:hypothetical protein [Candidatus Nanopelagicales bacterium]